MTRVTIHLPAALRDDARITALYGLASSGTDLGGAAATLAGVIDAGGTMADRETELGDVRTRIAEVAQWVEILDQLGWIEGGAESVRASSEAVAMLIDSGLTAVENALSLGGDVAWAREKVVLGEAYSELRAQAGRLLMPGTPRALALWLDNESER